MPGSHPRQGRVKEAGFDTKNTQGRLGGPDIGLDLGLPDMDGVDVLKALRGGSRVPVLVLSARQASDEKVAALDAGADDYITKPFSG